jgi:hypothetical protein
MDKNLLEKMSLTPKTTEVVPTEVANVAPAPVKKPSLWDKIKHLKIDLYALPNQTIGMYCNVVTDHNNKLILKLKPEKSNATAAVTAIETALGDKFSIEVTSNNMFVISLADMG